MALALSGCAGRDDGVLTAGANSPSELRPLPVAYRPHATDLGSPRDLGALFAALSAATPAPISIVQIGDSHSAGDYFSARLRELFQARFGAAGRGVLPPGIPDTYYKPKLVAVTESDGWQRITSRDAAAVAPFGVAGVVQQTTASGETMTLTSGEAEGFDRVLVDFRRRPDGGSLVLSVDGGPPSAVSTRGAPDKVVRAAFAGPPHGRTLTLQTDGDGPVELIGWGTWRHGRGVLYQNFGIVGAQADVLARYDRQALATELAESSLVVLVYGTNEAFGPASDLADYAARFVAGVRELQAAAPHASILIVGPPDVNRSAATATAGGVTCEAGPPPQTALPTLFVGYTQQAGHSRTTHPASTHRQTPYHPLPEWVRPAQLDTVQQVQRAAAARFGWYFWDWSAAMGGPCSMVNWVTAGLGRSDHVHMTIDGYSRSADLLFAELMDRYDAWLRLRITRPPRTTEAPATGSDTETASAPQ